MLRQDGAHFEIRCSHFTTKVFRPSREIFGRSDCLKSELFVHGSISRLGYGYQAIYWQCATEVDVWLCKFVLKVLLFAVRLATHMLAYIIRRIINR